MYISIVAFGTWGDVRPYCVLGQALQDRGHQVQVIASKTFEEWIRARGLDFYPLTIDVQALMAEMMDDELNLLDAIRVNREYIAPAMLEIGMDILKATDGADALMTMQAGIAIGNGIIEQRGLKTVIANLQPLTRTASYTNSAFPELPERLPLRGRLNQLTHTFVEFMMWSMYGRSHGNTIRTDHLNLAKYTWGDFQRDLKQLPTITCVSKHVIPRPADWRDNHHLTGFLFDDDTDWQPPDGLREFLDGGDKPVYIGFGSMSSKNPQATTELLLQAIAQAGVRAVLLSGWAGFGADDLPETVHVLNYAPHSWLFPKMAGVVHHGGAGTTAAGLRAGVPAFVVPHGADQPFWGRRVYALGAGVLPIGRKSLTVESLAAALRDLTQSDALRKTAADTGEKIRNEDSVGQAIAVIDAALA